VLRLILLVVPLLLAGCVPSTSSAFAIGSAQNCQGVTVVVNYGILQEDRSTQCVDLLEGEAVALDVLNFAGFELEGTETFGDQVVCRVNAQPSATEAFLVEGEDPYIETCADMPPAFGYWALWLKTNELGEWGYAESGVSSLLLNSGDTIGLVFSSAGDTPLPTDP